VKRRTTAAQSIHAVEYKEGRSRRTPIITGEKNKIRIFTGEKNEIRIRIRISTSVVFGIDIHLGIGKRRPQGIQEHYEEEFRKRRHKKKGSGRWLCDKQSKLRRSHLLHYEVRFREQID
jgi:hypothetical protein